MEKRDACCKESNKSLCDESSRPASFQPTSAQLLADVCQLKRENKMATDGTSGPLHRHTTHTVAGGV